MANRKTTLLISTEPVYYLKATNFMQNYVEKMHEDENTPNLIWFLEHEPIYTYGTSAQPSEIKHSQNSGYFPTSISEIPLYKTNRGGKITYHGPGQRIIYLMLRLREFYNPLDIKKYVCDLENVVIQALSQIDICAQIHPQNIGVWIDEEKIAAIGVKIYRWISYHGIAININPDLKNYENIVPCGLENSGVTSVIKKYRELNKYYNKEWDKISVILDRYLKLALEEKFNIKFFRYDKIDTLFN